MIFELNDLKNISPEDSSLCDLCGFINIVHLYSGKSMTIEAIVQSNIIRIFEEVLAKFGMWCLMYKYCGRRNLPVMLVIN